MQNLNAIPIVGKFTDVASTANNNFAAVKLAIDQLELTVSRAKGMFSSASALTTKYPSPAVGDWAIVQDSSVSPAVANVYLCSTAGTWSNTGQAWEGGSVDLDGYALLTDVSECGYYTCNTGASTAAKTVSATGYHLKVGGNVRILMSYANTAANPTLNIGSTGAKPLYYNGAVASSSNSWEADEVLVVYYDGTNYQATNSLGGGGEAEKIKYDNSQSALPATNVQDAIDILSEDVDNTETRLINIQNDVNDLNEEVFEMSEHLTPISHSIAQHYSIGDDGKLTYAAQEAATIYYIPVTQGDNINVNVVFPQSRPIKLGVYAQIAVDQASLQYISRANTTSYNETILIEHDGFLAMYIYVSSGYTPTTFTYSKLAYSKGDSKIQELREDVDALKDAIGTRTYKTPVSVSELYIDDTTGEIKSHFSQGGYYFPVNQGEHIFADINLAATGKVRYGFISSPPSLGSLATGYGSVMDASAYNLELDAPINGYFMATNSGGISSMQVYTQSGITMQEIKDELDGQQNEINELNIALEKFKKPSYCSAFDLPLSGTGSASLLAQGQYLQSSIGVYTDDDMCGFRFTPNGSSFEIRFGKLANIGGTMFAVKKSSSGSQLITYKINDSGSYVTVKTETLPFNLLSGVEYYARVEKYVYNNIIFVVTLTSNDGKYFQTKAGYSAGRGWGKYYIIAQTGSATNISIREWSAYKKECWLMFVGHSYVEGVSTEGFSENKFTKMMQEELGYKECAIMGMGGDTISGVVSKFTGYVDTMGYRPKYAAIVAGANDTTTSYNSMVSSFQNFISKCEANNIIPILFTINPRYDTNNAQWNNVNTWIRQSGELFVDMYYCFVDANGNAIADHYLDQIHPTEEVHKAIFQRMIEDVPEILNEQ